MMKVRTSVRDTDHGYKRLMAEVGGVANITVGVQGKTAEKAHSDSELTIGQVAAIHELGLGVPERSWLRSWVDENAQRVQSDLRDALQLVMSLKQSRKKAYEAVGFGWVKAIRQKILSGKIRPALAASTIAAKGHSIPLVESGELMNGIEFALFLPQVKSIRDPAAREAVRKGPK